MKNILKHITPLLIGGVILPLCTYTWMFKPQHPIIPQVKNEVSIPGKEDNTIHLYILNDVMAKLLPVLNLFK